MKMHIGGKWIEGTSSSKIEKLSPINGKRLYSFKGASKDDVDKAIRGAYEAFPKWSSMTEVERSKYIYKALDLISKSRKELERIIYNENGKLPKEAKEEVDGTIDQMQYYAEFARKLNGSIIEGTTRTRKIFQYAVSASFASLPGHPETGMITLRSFRARHVYIKLAKAHAF